MSNPIIWPGSSSFTTGSTSFGFYDADSAFQIDADKVARFCAIRLGYPLVDVELQDKNFYTAFEEAITTYGNELYAYKVRDNQLSAEGGSLNTDMNNTIVTPNMGSIVRLAKQYGSEAGSGGNVDYHKAYIPLTSSIQDYDVTQFVDTTSSSIEIKRVFFEAAPSITQYYDPYSGTGFGLQGMMNSFGFGGMSPAINFLMMPLNYDLQTIQAIEMAQQVRRSNFSFEIKNNTLRVFPIPNVDDGRIWFEYIYNQDRIDSSFQYAPNSISNVSNIPYSNPVYSDINSIGRQWIFEYTLAIAKEMLGYVRGKYEVIPIPNQTTTLNHAALIAAATSEKTSLIDRLRQYFDETSRKALLERRAQETEHVNQQLNSTPMCIYIG